MWLPTLAALALHVAVAAGDDLSRAIQVKPRSPFTGDGFHAIAEQLNVHLARSFHATRPCRLWSLTDLNSVARVLLPLVDGRLDGVYRKAGDRRALRHSTAEDWEAETAAAGGDATSALHAALRDGKCADLAMLWAHHLPAAARTALAQTDLVLPLLSTLDHTDTLAALRGGGNARNASAAGLYAKQTSCSICHSSAADSAAEPVPPQRLSTGAPPPVHRAAWPLAASPRAAPHYSYGRQEPSY